MLKQEGYTTGHFGKWHLGSLTREVGDGRRGGPKHPEYYSPPWEHGFDVCFSSEAQMPLWNPMEEQKFPSRYWNERGEADTANLGGDDSRVIMDRVVPFIEAAASGNQPFFAVIWFHTPHAPVVAGPEYRAKYAELPDNKQHYYGCITAMDEQVGRLNQLLKDVGAEQDTLLFFCSDNGPEGLNENGDGDGRNCGSTGGLRGRKRSLYNGGIAVPACVKWPSRIQPGTVYRMPCSTLDYFPTVAELVGFRMPDSRPIDGVSLLPLFMGESDVRAKPIPYRFVSSKLGMSGSPTFGIIDNRYKLLTNLNANPDEDMVYDLIEDPYEQTNIMERQTDFAAKMKAYLEVQLASFRSSHYGEDYGKPEYKPLSEFTTNETNWSGG
jgi:arylsulfatase A-like enzyme